MSHKTPLVGMFACLLATAAFAETPLEISDPDGKSQHLLSEYSNSLLQLDIGFTNAVEKLQSQYAKEELKTRNATSKSLSQLLSETMKSGKLDAAIRLRDSINAFDQSVSRSPTVGCEKAIVSLKSEVESLKKAINRLQTELNGYRAENPKDASATFRFIAGAEKPQNFENGQRYFTNRKYVLRDLTGHAKFGKFFPLEGGGATPVEIYVTRPGVLYIAVAETDEFDPKRKDGNWIDTGLRFSINSKSGNRMMIYMRDTPVGRMVLERVGFACPTLLVPTDIGE